jgi:hypothetical protein
VKLIATIALSALAVTAQDATWKDLSPALPHMHYVALDSWQESAGRWAFTGHSFGVWDDQKQVYAAGATVEDSFDTTPRYRYHGELVCAWGDRAILNKANPTEQFGSKDPECSSLKRPSGLNYKQVAIDWLEVARFLKMGHGDVVTLRLKDKAK